MGYVISEYLVLQNMANELKRNITNLIMASEDLSMKNRIELVRGLDVKVINSSVVVSSLFPGKFFALNNGSPTFNKPFNWIERAMGISHINTDKVVVDALMSTGVR